MDDEIRVSESGEWQNVIADRRKAKAALGQIVKAPKV